MFSLKKIRRAYPELNRTLMDSKKTGIMIQGEKKKNILRQKKKK